MLKRQGLFNQRALKVALASLIVFNLNACLALGSIGIPAPGTISGTQVKEKVAESSLIGFAFGISWYCSGFSNSSACESSLSDGRSQGMILASAMTPDLTPVDERKYYGSYQAGACADSVFFMFWFLTGAYISSKENSSGVTLTDPTGTVTESAAVTALLAGPACGDGLNSTESSDSESEEEGSESESSSSLAPALPSSRSPGLPGFNEVFKPAPSLGE